MHYSDELCMDELRRNTDPNVILYIALMKGITPIVTIGDHKSFVADLSPPKKDKRRGRKLPKKLNDLRDKLENKLRHLWTWHDIAWQGTWRRLLYGRKWRMV
jgi:hypothetical protein